MRLKSLTNDQTVPRYRYFNFYKPHKVDGKGFSSQMPTLKSVPSDQKSKRRTCAEECQMPFKFGKRVASESVWYGSFNLVRQTSFSSTGPAALCDTGAAADSDAALLMCRA